MSLYNCANGMNAVLAIAMSPFLPRQAEKFPRFRNVFTSADGSPVDGHIFVYTRMGGGNRECDCDASGTCGACIADSIELDANCVSRYDDECDSTYSMFVFLVPDEHRSDYDILANGGDISDLSLWYKSRLREMFPNDVGHAKTSFVVSMLCNDLSEEQLEELKSAILKSRERDMP